ncbi:MAG: hypothetical protein Q4D98_10085 [Planctomycetia bacterium]|nr:hypothetical protein [Planctomycetia bacterium]
MRTFFWISCFWSCWFSTLYADWLGEFRAAGMPEEILFVTRKPSFDGHWYANIGYYADNSCRVPFPRNSGGAIWIYNTTTRQVRKILDDPKGNVRDPQIHYDAEKLIFSYLPCGKKHYSLFEMNLDGTGLRQITGLGEDTPIAIPPGVTPLETTEIRRSPENLDGRQDYAPPGWDDYEPIYTPDDQIIFCSTRAKRYVQCYYTQVGTLHKCNLDGTNIHEISANVEQDNTPWMLPDGRVAHMRWEYVDRHWGTYHHLWTMNPDGTRQMILYGNFASWDAMLAPKPIPGTEKIVCTFSPGHGRREHYGRIVVLDTRLKPENPQAVRPISKKPADHSDPWAFSENHFLAAAGTKIVLVRGNGEEEVLYQLPEELRKEDFWIGEPRPVMKRPREEILVDQTDPTKDYGTLALVNIYRGRRMKDVPPGTVKNLLIYEVLPKPVNFSGGMDMISNEGTFSVERLIGSVPVSPEGSAYFHLPAKRSFLFCAMDEKGHCVKRMHSFVAVMPGEMTTCIGCHEERTETPNADDRDRLNHLLRTVAVRPEPVEGVPEIFSFPRDIQPILDKHCLACHNHDREEGGVNISGDWNPLYTFGYMQMSWRKLFGDNRNRSMGDFPPYAIGTGSSRLLKLMEEGHEGVKMSEQELKIIRHWLDAGANYAGIYAASGCGGLGYYVAHVNIRNDRAWPETAASEEVIRRRCDGCHCPTEEEKKIGTYGLNTEYKATYYPPQKNMYLAHTMCEESGRFNRHEIYNLSYPEKSKVLRGPLAKEAGGLGTCQAKSGTPVFTDTSDPDYQTILKYIQRGRKYILEEDNRFSMLHPSVNNGENCPQVFIPRWGYLREMIRYGILPMTTTPKTPIDPYDVEGRYWASLHYTPPKP